ncbi:MAG: hypothetical protein ETSY2_04075 [Candidatus Entotheonella gemina]|uniref:UGSC-like domain-containing protein n=1 Tax=Candidatus Entotheonella gemina TaxID=1429439 RepID=W4MG51_9BACT|nr:hypothetical protein [Candidatus Entotheonella palauensis]ETX08657.1 MAG: hypothetical protein ETSY2_04075 [Candidatus Entotheonella gemina]
MENRGVPTVMVCTDEFSQLGRNEAESLGLPYLPIALVPHPLGGQKPDRILEKAEKSIDQVVAIATSPVPDLVERFRGKV